jgi:two-component system cell cycle response regulator
MKRILNVDDDPTIRSLVRDILLASNFDVVSAADGYEALKLIEHTEVSAIILDVEMPGMSGLDVLTRLRLHQKTSEIPVIMLTCQSNPEDVMEGYNVGASYYITKPFTPDQLLYGLSLVGVERG